MPRRRKLASRKPHGNKPEELEDEDLPEANEDEDGADAEDEEDDLNAEGDDDDPEAEGEDDDPEAEDDEEAPAARSRAARARSRRPSLAAERARCTGLSALSKQASRLGVRFDASKAIANGTSVSAARARILDAAANAGGDEISTAAHRGSRRSAGGSRPLSRDAKAAAWRKAIKG